MPDPCKWHRATPSVPPVGAANAYPKYRKFTKILQTDVLYRGLGFSPFTGFGVLQFLNILFFGLVISNFDQNLFYIINTNRFSVCSEEISIAVLSMEKS